MFDIGFYQRLNGQSDYESLESIRSHDPVVYNIETTNACNMKCKMCPRTTMMTRKVETMEPWVFEKVVSQMRPHLKGEWDKWKVYVQQRYGISEWEMSENHYFLYVIPDIIQLHGYGDPLLDLNMAYYVKTLSEKGFRSYFSCNPANMNLDRTIEMFENGLTYIKFSIESVYDDRHKALRGEKSDFSSSYEKILGLLRIKTAMELKTVIVITMLDLDQPDQWKQYLELQRLFADKDVYVYLKSQDTQWLTKEYHGTNSIHWTEPCKHPWMSMTIKSNGDAAMCMEDYNNDIVLGNVKEESLYSIWNGKKYDDLRRGHLELTEPRCMEKCDMTLMGGQ